VLPKGDGCWTKRLLERGLADIRAGRFSSADEVFDRLEAKYARMADERGEN
jgi:predicted transcriptional regulator